jgi:hypothetical protein
VLEKFLKKGVISVFISLFDRWLQQTGRPWPTTDEQYVKVLLLELLISTLMIPLAGRGFSVIHSRKRFSRGSN